MHGWAPSVIAAIGSPKTKGEDFLRIFFSPSLASQEAGHQFFKRIGIRQAHRDVDSTWATRNAQYDAIVRWGIPNHALLERLTAIAMPTFVVSGDSDPMILPRYSHLLAGLLPNARIKVYPDAAHGFLFQHHNEFASDVSDFLDEAPGPQDTHV
jgi:pimeloyl-ACP methyl ester carboxylesterase